MVFTRIGATRSKECKTRVLRRALTAAALFCSLLRLLCPSSAKADGMVFDRSSFQPLYYNEQRAAIRFEKGIERMVIALNLERPYGYDQKYSGNAIWIFPVRGDPKRTNVDLVDSFPVFRGYPLFWEAAKVPTTAWAMAALIPFIVPAVLLPYYMPYGASQPTVLKFGEVDRWGIHAEVIKAESMKDLKDYLGQHRVDVSEKYLKTFHRYLSEEYCLVAAWISSAEKMKEKFHDSKVPNDFWTVLRPCLYVEFPTETGFYPLVPTSGYGSLSSTITMRITIHILGHVTPDMSWIDPSTERLSGKNFTDYEPFKYVRDRKFYSVRPFTLSSYGVDELARTAPKKLIEGLREPDLAYTRVMIQCQPQYLTGDLKFVLRTPLSWQYANLLIRAPFLLLLVLTVVVGSYVSGGIAGWYLYGEASRYACMGLWNLLTVIALGCAVHYSRKKSLQLPCHLLYSLLHLDNLGSPSDPGPLGIFAWRYSVKSFSRLPGPR